MSLWLQPGEATRSVGRSFVLLWVACATTFISYGAVATFVPRYVAGPLRSGPVTIGIIAAAFAIGAFLVRPVAGQTADRRGRRIVVLAGAATMALGGLAHVPHLGVAGLMVARVLLGIGEGAVFTAGMAWAVDLSPERRRGRLLGLFGLSIWLGLAVGPLLADAAYAAGGFTGVWLLAAAAPLVGAALILTIPTDKTAVAHHGAEAVPRELFPRAARRPGLSIGLASVGNGTLTSFAVLMLHTRGVHGATFVFSAFALGVVGARLALGGLPDRIGARRCAVAAGLVEAAGLAVLAQASSLTGALIGAALVGAGHSIMYPALALLVLHNAHPQQHAAALGAFTGFYDIGTAVAGPAVGAVAAVAGYSGAFALAAASAVAAAIATGSGRRTAAAFPAPALADPLTQ
jgi:MFS family permease